MFNVNVKVTTVFYELNENIPKYWNMFIAYPNSKRDIKAETCNIYRHVFIEGI